MLVLRLNIKINKLDSNNARLVRFPDWKGLQTSQTSQYLKHIFKYFSSQINLQNGRPQILDLLEIADFSHGIDFIFKAVIGQYNLRTKFLHSHWRK